jgi:AraC-like DNA-binding protein
MKLARSDCRWHVIPEDPVFHDCLESLAFRHGYRVACVCRELGVTEQHFRKIFQRDVGIRLKDWMRSERMVVARRMLSAGVSAAEISDLLGFAHTNCFRREFRKTYQVTVRDFLSKRSTDGRRASLAAGA